MQITLLPVSDISCGSKYDYLWIYGGTYIFWHFICHSFWHNPGIVFDMLSGIYSDIPSGILFGIYSGILSGMHSDILSGILFGFYLASILTFCLASILAFYLVFYPESIQELFRQSFWHLSAVFLTFFQAFSLTSSLACVRFEARSAASWARDIEFGSSVAHCLQRSRCGLGSVHAHSHDELAEEELHLC